MDVVQRDLAQILGQTALCVLVFDALGRIVSTAGGDVPALLGNDDIVIGSALDEVSQMPPALVPLVRAGLEGRREAGEIQVAGRTIQVLVSPIRKENGVADGAFVMAMGANRPKSSDEAFMRLFQASPVPISISTMDRGIFSHCNDAFVRVFEYPREEVVGHGSVDLGMWTPEERAKAIGKLREQGFLSGHESTVRTKSGLVRDTIFNMEKIEFEGQMRLVGFFFDITERKRAEEELRGLYEHLKDLDQLKSQLMANVSHELRTPLTLVLGLAERLVRRDDIVISARSDIEGIRRNAQVLLQQVNALLDVARLDSGRMQAQYSALDLARFVRLVASPFDVLAQEHGVTYAIETPESLPAEVDADKLERIVVNLLSNAFKFVPRGGIVRCRVESIVDDKVRIQVADSGPGIAPAQRDRIFERFFQVEGSATRRYGGTGLGLAIVREFTELLHGRAFADAAPEGGALLVVELPLHAPPGTDVETSLEERTKGSAHLAMAEMSQSTILPASTDLMTEGRSLVLVVDDNADMRKFVADSLADTYRVVTAVDGEDGWTKTIALRPDIVVTDMMMPKLSGDQLVQIIRQRAELADMPILLLTARADDELRARLLREGAQDYLTKPFSVDELRARVANQIAIKRSKENLQSEISTQTRTAQQNLIEKLAAERANQAKSEFLSSMSHELRTPLNGILGFAQILERSPALSTNDRENVQIISKSGQHLLMLINDVLDLAKIEAGNMELLPRVFDFDSMVRTVVNLSRVRANQKKIDFVDESASVAIGHVIADEKRLIQVLLNLLGNAIKFTNSGRVSFRIREVDGALDDARALRFEIEDTGPGIAADDIARIFEPFVQVGEATVKHEGTGLGLSITKRLVTQMGGSIEVRSEIGKGSVFAVNLILSRAPSIPSLQSSSWADSIVGYDGPRRTILVVDDHADNRRMLETLLSHLGFLVQLADSGPSALRLAAEHHPDLVLMDLAMAGMDGFETTRRMRAMANFSAVPIIACSASLSNERRTASTNAGCDGFLAKPIQVPTLLELLGRRLGLSWKHKLEAALVETTVPLRFPERDLLLILLDFAKQGRLMDLTDHASRIARQDVGLDRWYTEIRSLADDFEIEKLCARLEADIAAIRKND